jgi:hypothetical protein
MSSSPARDLIQIERPTPPAVVAEMAPIVQAANNTAVVDVESHAVALNRVRALRAAEKVITDYFEPARRAADEAKREILRARDGLIAPITAARSIYDRKAGDYEAEQRRIAEQEQRRLEAEARKREEERQLQDAIDAEARGDEQEAAQIMSESVTTPVIQIQPRVAQVEGVSSQTRWSAEVSDLLALVQYVAAHPEWISLLEPSMPNLNRLAVAQRQALSIPGVKAVSKTVRATR